jgi:glutamyl-tRNA reductase
MPLVCLGISHHEAPAEVRGRHAFPPERMAEALVALHDYDTVREAAMLSTCNRLEIYADITDAEQGVRQLKTFLVNFRHSDVPYDLEPYLYTLFETAAITHMMRVATGLDSMLIGEAEILGQVKEAYHQAQRARSVGKTLHRLFREAINAGKAARSSTTIGNESVSFATVAIAQAKHVVGSLAGKNIVLFGAGQMGRTAAKRLKLEGAHQCIVVNRTRERAEELVADFGIGTAAGLPELPAALRDADIVISSTGALTFVLTPDLIAAAMDGRAHRPLCLIDIAVPRDVDPAVSAIPGVSLTDIDRLSETIDVTLEHRQAAIPLVEQIIDAHVLAFELWYKANETLPVVALLARKAEALREAEIERLFARCPGLGKRERTLVTGLSRRIISKLLHPAMVSIRSDSAEQLADSALRARLIDQIFALSELAPLADVAQDDSGGTRPV